MTELSNDLKIKAQWCADLMRADGITPDHVAAMSDEQRHDLAMSYMNAITRKIEEIQGIYLTRNGAKEAFNNRILSMF